MTGRVSQSPDVCYLRRVLLPPSHKDVKISQRSTRAASVPRSDIATMTAMFQIILSCWVLVVVHGGVTGTADKTLTFGFQESVENLCLFTCSNCFDATVSLEYKPVTV